MRAALVAPAVCLVLSRRLLGNRLRVLFRFCLYMWQLCSLCDASYRQWWDWLLTGWRKPVFNHVSAPLHSTPNLSPLLSSLVTLAGPGGVILSEQALNPNSSSESISIHSSEACRVSTGVGTASWIALQRSGWKS